jgi:hypothetical protein
MLLSLMIACAGVAVLLFAMGAFSDLLDLWAHPDHRPVEHDPRFHKPKEPLKNSPIHRRSG